MAELRYRGQQLLRPHQYYRCSSRCEGCHYCEGGLHWCTVCGGREGELLSSCPGHKLSAETLEACYRGNVVDLPTAEAMVLCRRGIGKRMQ